jgi:hypothetical protein
MTRAAAAVLLWAAPGPALATTISLVTETTATFKPGAVSVAIKVTNAGDEAASSVTPAVRLFGQEGRAQPRASLRPGETMEAAVELPLAALLPGQWPLSATVDYADANGYPFQALQLALVSTPGATPSLVAVLGVEAEPIQGSGSLRARIKSLSEAARPVRAQFYVPRGLELSAPAQTLTLGPWAEMEVRGKVVNRAALPGSRYPVFATVEYEDGSGHHAAVGHAIAEIGGPRKVPAWYAWAGAGALLLAWVLLLAYRRWRPAPAPQRPRGGGGAQGV